MIQRFVAMCLRRRALVTGLIVLTGLFGYQSWTTLSIEAYPDIADTTAQVITQYLGHAAEEVEEQVTIPIERALNGLPGMHVMRSKSTFGLSLITLVFRDGVEDYWARQRIRERIENVDLPPGADPTLDPLTSPIGEIYRYTLESSSRGQRELRELQQWVVVPALRQVFGVADITSFGGETTQFQLLIDPARLVQFNLSLRQVIDAVQTNNSNAGGSIVVRGDQGFVVRGVGLIRSLVDLGNIVVSEKEGTPVYLKNLGEVRLGALERRGVLGRDKNADGVSGIVLLLRGMNPSKVLDEIHAKVELLNHGGLPPGVRVVPYLDRTDLVRTTLNTVSHTLLEGIGLVLLVLILFLGSPRAALIVATTIPLSLLIAFILMRFTDIPANLLSLGAIDFGIIVDAAIVVLESVLSLREQRPEAELSEADVRGAAITVAKPIFYSKLIIIAAYLPLFAFERVEKKLFTPMAYTVAYALIGATLLALALIPGLALAAYRKPRKLFHNRVLEAMNRGYVHAVERILRAPYRLAIVPGIVAAIAALVLGGVVGKEFLPELDEGSLWLQVQLPPGLSLEKASDMASEVRAAALEFPQVKYIVTQLGRNDDGTDPWTPSHIESSVGLTPYATWPEGMLKRDLVGKLAARFAKLPGLAVGFSQPMIDGVNDKVSGAHSEIVIKVFGDDLADIRRSAEAIKATVMGIRGAVDVAIDQEPPLPQIQITVNREAAARFGINVGALAELIEVGIGGRPVGQLFLGERRYEIAVRFDPKSRDTPEDIGNLTLPTQRGARIPMSQLSKIQLTSGESTITREANRRHLTIKVNLRGRDFSSFFAEANPKIARQMEGQTDLEVKWGGQFENQNRAQGRLAIVIPGVLGVIFLILFGVFGNARHPALILSNVPLAALGGMAALVLRGMTLNVSSAVGFIALFGISMQNGVIMVSNLNLLRDSGLSLTEAVARGAGERFRPVLMTALVAALGLVPAALARGIGSDVQRPLATVIVGGLITATVLALFVLPAIYLVVERRYVGERAEGEDL